MAQMHRGAVPALLRAFMRRSLRGTFSRVEWVGPRPVVPPDRPVILLANHPSFYDGYLGWIVSEFVLGRRVLVWMQEWDRYPLFAPMGALPFPKDNPAERAATMRATAKLLQSPAYALLYFAEGHITGPDHPLAPFDGRLIARLDRLLPPHTWLPLAMHLTWDGRERPLVRLMAGEPTPTLIGDEHARLAGLLETLRSPNAAEGSVETLLAGPSSTADHWDLNFTRAYFRRFLPR